MSRQAKRERVDVGAAHQLVERLPVAAAGRRRSARPRPPGLPLGGRSDLPRPERLRTVTRCSGPRSRRRAAWLAGLLVEGVAAVPAAVLLHLDALTVVDLALHRDVVPPLALLAGQRDLDPLVVLGHARLLTVYLSILMTRPAPTVRPPSRIANRRPSSIAIGLPQLDRHLGVVTRHHHLGALGQLDRAGDVGGAEIELRVVVREERRVPPTLLLGQDVHLRGEVRVRRDRARLRQHLTALDVFLLRAAQQGADVVAGPTLVEELAEHLHTRARRLGGRAQTDDLDLLTDLHRSRAPPGRSRPCPDR